MPGEFRGRCSDCGHEWNALEFSVSTGEIDYRKPDTYCCYFCPKCCVHLNVPRLIDANSWQRWLAAHAADVRDSRLVSVACARISATPTSNRTIYSPKEIDISPLTCPECNENMPP